MPASKPIGSAVEKSIPHSDGPIRAIDTGDMCRLFGLYGNPTIDAPLEELADFVRTYWSYSPTMGRKRHFFSVELAMLNYLKDEEEGSVSEGIAEGVKNLGDEFMDRNVLGLMGVKDYPALIERYTRLKESGQDIGIESAFVGANLHIRRMVAHGLVVTEHQNRSRAGAIISKAKSVDFAITKKGHALIYLLDEFYEFNMIRNTKDFLLDGEQSIVFNGMAYEDIDEFLEEFLFNYTEDMEKIQGENLRSPYRKAKDMPRPDLSHRAEENRTKKNTGFQLVSLHRGFDGLSCRHRRTGRFSGWTRIWMLRGFPGTRLMSPARSRFRTI